MRIRHLIALVVVPMLLFVPEAIAAGTITGTVTRDTGSTPETPGDAISGACVRALNLNGDPSVNPSEVKTTTDVNGDYSLDVSANGRWGVQFYTCPNEPGHSFVAEWAGDPNTRTAFGQEFTIADGATVTRDASLADGGSIAGVVTDPEGLPVEGACVTPYNNQGIWENLPPAKTNAQGEYRIGGLLGQYIVAFDAGFEGCAPNEPLLFEYYGNTRNSDDATVLHMTTSVHLFPPNGVDAQLEAAASVTGVITDHEGNPIEGACASLDPAEEDGESAGPGFTDANGRYAIKSVVPGDYKLRFSSCGQNGDLDEYWQNQPDYDSADVITLVAGAQPDEYDAQLQAPPSVSGTVTDSDDDPAAGVCVTLYDAEDGDYLDDETTDADGEYAFDDADAFDDMEGTQVLVEFDPCTQGSMLLGEWYDDQPDEDSATPITVAGPVTGIDAELAKAYGIAGTVTGGGNPIPGICVFLTNPQGESHYADDTDGGGHYSTGPLEPGDYLVRFTPCNGGGWLGEYYNDSLNRQGADPVTITAVSGAVADAELTQGGKISGTVSGPSGPVGAGHVCVSLRKAGSGARVQLASEVKTTAAGTYLVEGLPTGEYVVRFAACYVQDDGTQNLQTEFYADALTADEADPVPVTAGATTPNISPTLGEGARISGVLTDGETGNPIPGVCVAAGSADGTFGSDDVTNNDGYYTIPALTPGDYVIRFNSCGSSQHMPEYWENAYTRAEATLFTASAGNNTADAVLEGGSSISGRLTGPNGEPAPGICPEILDAETGDYLQGRGDASDLDGNYTISQVPPGQVKVRFYNCDSSDYIGEYYEDSKRFGGAKAITVAPDAPTQGINATLERGGSISGIVTGPGGSPAEEVCVRALREDDERFDGLRAETDEDGHYRIRGLASGEYTLVFSDCGGNDLADEWWNDKSSRDAADVIAVTAGQNVTDKNAQLALEEEGGGAIQGSVTDPGGGDSSDACVDVYDAVTGEPVGNDGVYEGSYRVDRLPAGDYKVGFEDCGGGNLASEFYGGPTSDGVRTLDEAAVIQLAEGETISGIDAELAIGARITGRVTGPDGGGVATVCVFVYDAQDPEYFFTAPETREDGRYAAKGLAPGEYKVEFDPECFGGSSRLEAEYYDDAASFEAATTVVVGAAGTTVTDINAVLAAKPSAAVGVTSGPTGQTTERRPTFGFNPSGDADVECSIDAGTPVWGPCSGQNSHTPGADLADGSYTFRVRVTTDWDQAVATRAFSVGTPTDPTGPTDPGPGDPDPPVPGPGADNTAPSVKFDGGPAGKTRDRTPTFAFSSNDPTAKFTCAVDGKPAVACTSPFTLKKLAKGKHVFRVTATDAAGNSSAADQSFKVKKKRKRR